MRIGYVQFQINGIGAAKKFPGDANSRTKPTTPNNDGISGIKCFNTDDHSGIKTDTHSVIIIDQFNGPTAQNDEKE